MDQFDVVVIGAGAAGMMCAAEAGKRGRSVLVIDHAAKPGEKIRISGGGRCNFTNLHAAPSNFISQNPSFAISALRRYTQRDFIALVERYGIAYHEKTLGQLFCDGSSKQIVDLLLNEMRGARWSFASPPPLRRWRKPGRGSRSGSSKASCNAARSWWQRAENRSRRWAPRASATISRRSSA